MISLFILVPSIVDAGGPMYKQKDPLLQNEIENIYHDIRTGTGGGGSGSDLLTSTNTWSGGNTFQSSTSFSNVTSVQMTSVSTWTLNTVRFEVFNSTIVLTGSNTLGIVKQIVSCTSVTSSSTTGSSFQSTPLQCQITPTSASSSVLIQAGGPLQNLTTNRISAFATIANGTTDLMSGAGCQFATAASGLSVGIVPCFMQVYNSPASTSQQTYRVRLANSDGASGVQWGNNGYLQTMILTEYGAAF